MFREYLQFNIVSSWFKVIYDMGDRIDDVYFPFNALVSLVKGMADDKVVAVGLVGSDGMTGVAGLLGGGVSSERAIVQIPNSGVRTKIAVIRKGFRRGGPLQNILLAYLNRLMHQISQTAACNAIHTAEEQLAPWFLMCQDRVDSEELNLTSGVYRRNDWHTTSDHNRGNLDTSIGPDNSLPRCGYVSSVLCSVFVTSLATNLIFMLQKRITRHTWRWAAD